MNNTVIYIDTSEILEGKLELLKSAMKNLAAFVKQNMPRLIYYGFYLDEMENKMTVISIHPDSSSLEYHLNTGNEEFRKFSELIRLIKMDVYGDVSKAAIERLRLKSKMLGSGILTVNKLYAGFSRKDFT